MTAKQIVPGLLEIPLGAVNVFFLEDPDDLKAGGTLIDTGLPGSVDQIFTGLKQIGKVPADVRRILVTHAHPDHIGSLAAVQKITGAETFIHPLEAPLAATGTGWKQLTRTPGLLSWAIFTFLVHPPVSVEPARIDREIIDGQELPIAGGITAIHVPGHTPGQLAFLWRRHGGVLFTADAAMNLAGLRLAIGYEDLTIAQRSLRHLGDFDFQTACFGHGGAITKNAADRFRQKWPTVPRSAASGNAAWG